MERAFTFDLGPTGLIRQLHAAGGAVPANVAEAGRPEAACGAALAVRLARISQAEMRLAIGLVKKEFAPPALEMTRSGKPGDVTAA